MLFHSYRPFAKILKYKMKLSLVLNTIILLFFIFLLNSCLIKIKSIVVFENQSNDTLTIITNKHDLFEFVQTRVRKYEKDTFVEKKNFSDEFYKDSVWTSAMPSISLSKEPIKNLYDLRNILKDSTYIRFEDYQGYYYIKYNSDFGKLTKSDTTVIFPGKSLKLDYPGPIIFGDVQLPYFLFDEVVIYRGSKNHQIIIKDEALKKCFDLRKKHIKNYECWINKYTIY